MTTAVTLAGVSGIWQFGEDSKGRVAEILNPFGQYTSRQFDPDGKLTKETRANGTVTNYGYISRDWLSSIEHRLANGTVLDRFDYSYNRASTGVYDPSGHLRKETDAGGRVHGFDYDGLYRLTQETHPDFGAYNYTLDLNNNRTRRQQSTANIYSGYDAHNKLLWTNTTNVAPTSGQAAPYRKYTYNGNGEPTSIEHRDTTASPVVTDALEWDGMGKLRKVTSGGTVVYTVTYDGAGDRVQSTQSGATHTYSYGAGLLYDSVGSTTYTPGVSHRQAGADSFYHEDWIGSNRYTTDATGNTAPSGQRWDAFGNLTANAGSHGGSLRWVGGHGYEADGSLGMGVLGARNYDPSVGRFLTADPIGIGGGINQFAYVGGDPVSSVDPSGLEAEGVDDGGFADSTRRYNRTKGRLFGTVRKGGEAAYTALDIASGFNPGTAAAMAIDKAGKKDYLGAALSGGSIFGKIAGGIAGCGKRVGSWFSGLGKGSRAAGTTAIVVQHLPQWVTAAADSRGYVLMGRALNAGEGFGVGGITPSGWGAVHVWLDSADIARLASIRRGGAGYARIQVSTLNRLVGEGKIGIGENMRELRLLNQHLPEIRSLLTR